MRYLPECIFSARTVATMTAASGRSAGVAALDVDQLLEAQVAAEAALGDHVVGQLRPIGRPARTSCRGRCCRRARCARTRGVCSSVCSRFGLIASSSSTVIAPAAPRSSAVIGCFFLFVADDDAAQALAQVLDAGGEAQHGHDLRRDRDVERASRAGRRLPRRRGRRHVCAGRGRRCPRRAARRPKTGRSPASLPWLRWLSIIAASRLCAIETACVSPVRWRLKSSIGRTCELPPPAAPPLMPNVGPSEGWRIVGHRALADAVHRLRQADRRQRLALAQRRRRHAGDDDELAVGAVLESVEDFERDLGLVLPVVLNFVVQQSEIGSNFADRLEGCFLRDLKVALHLYDSLWCLWLRHRWPEHTTKARAGALCSMVTVAYENLTLLAGHNKRNLRLVNGSDAALTESKTRLDTCHDQMTQRPWGLGLPYDTDCRSRPKHGECPTGAGQHHLAAATPQAAPLGAGLMYAMHAVLEPNVVWRGLAHKLEKSPGLYRAFAWAGGEDQASLCSAVACARSAPCQQPPTPVPRPAPSSYATAPAAAPTRTAAARSTRR